MCLDTVGKTVEIARKIKQEVISINQDAHSERYQGFGCLLWYLNSNGPGSEIKSARQKPDKKKPNDSSRTTLSLPGRHTRISLSSLFPLSSTSLPSTSPPRRTLCYHNGEELKVDQTSSCISSNSLLPSPQRARANDLKMCTRSRAQPVPPMEYYLLSPAWYHATQPPISLISCQSLIFSLTGRYSVILCSLGQDLPFFCCFFSSFFLSSVFSFSLDSSSSDYQVVCTPCILQFRVMHSCTTARPSFWTACILSGCWDSKDVVILFYFISISCAEMGSSLTHLVLSRNQKHVINTNTRLPSPSTATSTALHFHCPRPNEARNASLTTTRRESFPFLHKTLQVRPASLLAASGTCTSSQAIWLVCCLLCIACRLFARQSAPLAAPSLFLSIICSSLYSLLFLYSLPSTLYSVVCTALSISLYPLLHASHCICSACARFFPH